MESFDFFIAYASPDRDYARDLYYALLDENCEAFLDVESIPAGTPWSSVLSDALQESRATIVLISSHSDDAFYQQEEIVRAIELSREPSKTHTIIPVILDGKLPYGLTSLQAIDSMISINPGN